MDTFTARQIYSWEETPVPIEYEAGGPQNGSQRFKEDRNFLFLQEFQARTVQLVAQSLYRQRCSG